MRALYCAGVAGLLLLGACDDSGVPVLDSSVDRGAVGDRTSGGDSSAGGGTCKPYCGGVGTSDEGWYDGCDHQLLVDPRGDKPLTGPCAGCEVTCRFIGSKSEAWYTSCATPYYGLIKYDQCGTK